MKCPVCSKGFNKNSRFVECRSCDSQTHSRCIEDFYDEDDFTCTNCETNESFDAESNHAKTLIEMNKEDEGADSDFDLDISDVYQSDPQTKANESINDSLVSHIKKYDLPFKLRPAISSNGNCWFESNTDLIKLFKMKSLPTDPDVLQIKVIESMYKHPRGKTMD